MFGRLILSAGQRMSQMVDDMLTVARLEAGDRRLTCEDVDLCREAVAMKIRLAPFEPPTRCAWLSTALAFTAFR